MKSTSHEKMMTGFGRMFLLAEASGHRGVLTRSKHVDTMDWNHIPPGTSHDLTDADGNFYFIPGVMAVDGTHPVRPDNAD